MWTMDCDGDVDVLTYLVTYCNFVVLARQWFGDSFIDDKAHSVDKVTLNLSMQMFKLADWFTTRLKWSKDKSMIKGV